MPLSRVGVGGEYDKRLFGPVSAFGALEASVGKDTGQSSYTPDLTAKAGFRVEW